MKSLFKICLFISFIFQIQIPAQWMKVSGPSRSVNSITTYGSNIFACGIEAYLSTDGGKSWISADNGLPEYRELLSSAMNGNEIYVGLDSDSIGVFRSTDFGSTWLPTGFRDTLSLQRRILSILLVEPKIILGTSDGIFISSDNGETWSRPDKELVSINVLAKDDPILYAGVSGQGIFASSDTGKTWISLNNGLPYLNVNSLAIKNDIIFAGISGRGIFLSTDHGANWVPANRGLSNFFVGALCINNNKIFAGTFGNSIRNGIYESDMDTIFWTHVDTSLFLNNNIFSLASSEDNIFAGALGSAGGVYRSTDKGLSWSTSGVNRNYVGPFAVFDNQENPDTIFLGSEGGIFYSIDKGVSWRNSGLLNFSIMCFAKLGSKFFAGTHRDGAFVSTDRGATWHSASNGLTNSGLYTLGVFSLAVNFDILFAGTELGVYKSSDYGLNWFPTDLKTTVRSLSVVESKIFTLTYTNAMFFTENNGETWTPINLPSGEKTNSFAVFMDSGMEIFAGTENGIYISSDYGSNWQYKGMEGIDVQRINGTKEYIFAPTNDIENSLFFSKDAGDTWNKISDELGTWFVSSVSIIGNYVFAATSDGAWRRPFSDLLTDINERNIPSNFSLGQNYPNPFNPNTTIIYSIPKTDFVVIKVYDILGKELKTLVNEEKAAGTYKAVFNADEYASGIYFYQIKTGNFVSTKKMILLR